MVEKPYAIFKMELAGIKIEVECLYKEVYKQCFDYIADFNQSDFTVRSTKEEIIAERMDISVEMNAVPGISVRYADEYLEPFIIHRKIAEKMIQFDTLLMHGAVVAIDNKAYMFTANSGVGKTTRAKLWLNEYPDSIIVNGDKPLIKITENNVLACGTPWCGNEGWNTNTMVPLQAIFLLERAENSEQTIIEEVSIGKAFPFLFEQTYRSMDVKLLKKTVALLKTLEGKVHVYKFYSTPTLESVRLAYETARPR